MTVFSAHGVSPAVHAEAERRQLRTIDATCPLVTKVHREAVKFAGEGYTIVLIGHAGHEEVEGTMGEAPEHIVLVETEDDVDSLEVADPTKIAYISQTTLSVDETRSIINRLREQVPAHHGPAHRRHLLRHDQPPGRRQADGAAVRSRARDRLAQLVELQPAGRGRARARRAVAPDRQRGAGRRGVARGRRDRRHHVGRERARGARQPARRVLPRARRQRRLGVRGRPGGRPLHAAQDDPPGDGGRPPSPQPARRAARRRARRARGGRRRALVGVSRRRIGERTRAHAVGLPDGLEAQRLGERERLRDVVDRPGGHAGRRQARHPLGGGRGVERALEDRAELLAALEPRDVRGEALVGRQLRAADRRRRGGRRSRRCRPRRRSRRRLRGTSRTARSTDAGCPGGPARRRRSGAPRPG